MGIPPPPVLPPPTVDTIQPTITITSPTDGQQFPSGTTTVQVTGTVTDNVVGTVGIEVSVDGSVFGQVAQVVV